MILSPSHSLFLEGYPKSKMSGIYIDKNGNWNIQVNLPLTILVETGPRKWEEARKIYITAAFKFKLNAKNVNKSTKKFAVTPKNIEVTNIKVIKAG